MTTRRGRARPVPDEALLNSLVGRVRRVPDRFRAFTDSATEAARRHGVDAGLLDTLTGLGLPCAHFATGPRYDTMDLANVSLALALPSPRIMAMRGWSAALRSAATAAPATYDLTVETNCPGRHDGPCSVEVAPRLRELPGFRISPAGAVTLTRPIPAGTTGVFPAVAALTDLVRPVHFHLLPDELRTDVGFLRDTGLADCGLAARYLHQEAAALGLTARYSFGLFIAVPYSVPHSWLDVYLGDAWVPFDPHLLNVLTGWGFLPADEWPSHRSIGDAAWRLGEHDFQIAWHPGRVASISFSTKARDT